MGRFNSNVLVVTGSNIGIGKATPNSKLDVNGNTIITGSLTVTDGVQIQGVGSDLIHPLLLMGA
jgi:hypothetical protein